MPTPLAIMKKAWAKAFNHICTSEEFPWNLKYYLHPPGGMREHLRKKKAESAEAAEEKKKALEEGKVNSQEK